MLENLADRPGIGSMNPIDLLGADAAGQFANPNQLVLQNAPDSLALDTSDQVRVIVTVVFTRFGSSAGDSVHAGTI